LRLEGLPYINWSNLEAVTGEYVSCLHDFRNAGIAGVQDKGRWLPYGFGDVNACGDRPEVESRGAAGDQQQIRCGGNDVYAGGGVRGHVDDGKGKVFLLCTFDRGGQRGGAGSLDRGRAFYPRTLPSDASISCAALRVGVDEDHLFLGLARGDGDMHRRVVLPLPPF
jgi:hypothetical protein